MNLPFFVYHFSLYQLKLLKSVFNNFIVSNKLIINLNYSVKRGEIKSLSTIKLKMQMMNPLYVFLFFLLIIQCTLFILITFSPRPLQKFIVNKFTTNAKMNAFWKGHLVFCAILILFFLDLHFTADTYQDQKRDLQMRGAYMASELRRAFLSYSILKIQRNKYIVFTLIFISIATHVYIRVLDHFYRVQDAHVPEDRHHHQNKNHKKNHQA